MSSAVRERQTAHEQKKSGRTFINVFTCSRTVLVVFVVPIYVTYVVAMMKSGQPPVLVELSCFAIVLKRKEIRWNFVFYCHCNSGVVH